jgi:predicted AAA+ superfamily ATPase
LQAVLANEPIRYWRDKAGREVDFVLARRRDQVDAIECKWNPADFDSSALKVFRSYYPRGRNYVVSPLAGEGYLKNAGKLTIRICNPSGIEI